MISSVSVVIPSISPRDQQRRHAIQSVFDQTVSPDRIHVEMDITHAGAAATRDRGLDRVDTEWVAFLDDDDELFPYHLDWLLDFAGETKADFVYPWYVVEGGTDPFPQYYRQPWDNDVPHQVPITTLVRTELAKDVHGFEQGFVPGVDELGNRTGEDYNFLLKCRDAGGRIVHLPEKTWVWKHHASNTSGRGDKW